MSVVLFRRLNKNKQGLKNTHISLEIRSPLLVYFENYQLHCNWSYVTLFRLWIFAVVAEWLRRLTWNQIPSGSVGSNPANCVTFNLSLESTFKTKRNSVRVCCLGYPQSPIHRCNPTTIWHGSFWLLGFPSDPVRFSLDNLDILGYPEISILMPNLARTSDRHSPT